MSRFPVHTVPVDDVTIAYSELGTGTPVVFINGLASTMDTWNPPVLTRLSAHFRVIIFDNRGTGYSTASGRPLSVPLMARDTAALMDAIGIAPAHIIGFSMGASIAQELVLAYPEKVTRLVLVAGECGGGEAVRAKPEIMAQLADKSGTAREVLDRMFSLIFPPSWLAAHDPCRFCPEVYEITGDDMVQRQTDAFLSWHGSFLRLVEIRSPTLVITGTDDMIVPPENSRILSGRIPGSQLVEIPGTGHGLLYQVPEIFSDRVINFLTCGTTSP